jgi:hypothetical protein
MSGKGADWSGRRRTGHVPGVLEMADRSVEVLSEAINMPVLRISGRNFPGVLIQGDTLSNLLSLARTIREEVRGVVDGDSELADLAEELADRLSEFLREYERVLKARGMPLPYASPFDDGTSRGEPA